MPNTLVKLFGESSVMKIVDYLMAADIDVTISDVCHEVGLSRKTVDTAIKRLIQGGLIRRTRTVGKTALFEFNKENPISQKLDEISKI